VAAVMSAAVVVGWYLVVPGEPAAILDAAGPVLIGPVILLLCVFVVAKLTMSGTAPFTRWCAGISILGAGAKSAADAMASGGVLGDRLHWFLALTVASHALLTIGVRVNQVQVAGNPTVLTRHRRPYSLLPYGAIALTYLLLILAVWRHQTGTVPIALGGAALSTLLVVGRQLAAFRENARLLSELNDKVRELHETKSGLDALAEQLRHQAYHDALSGLPNRALYAERLNAVLDSGAEAIVLVVDLDDFKLVNDEFGHAAGDALLRVLSGRILGCVRAGDTVARLGGDEFAVLLAPGSDPVAVAARIVAAVEAPVEVDGGTAQVGASVGIATSAALPAPVDGEAVLREADRAMYAAKRSGKGAYAIAP
jgi:diguanylate cyclase